jgi:hypothetical protein
MPAHPQRVASLPPRPASRSLREGFVEEGLESYSRAPTETRPELAATRIAATRVPTPSLP